MTTAQSNPVRKVPARLDYTPDRHAALMLVSRNKISSIGTVLGRRDGADLDPGVFASLLALRNARYVEMHEPPGGSQPRDQHWPVKLSLLGMQLLTRFNLEHAHALQVDGAPSAFRTADQIGSGSELEVSMARKRRNYSPEFREEAARLVVESHRGITEVAREIGVGETTLGNWVRDYRKTHSADEPPLELSERARLAELDRRNRELEMENTFLKKAAAYFAKEQR